MLTNEEVTTRQSEAAALIENAGLLLTNAEKASVEIADFGLSEFAQIGLGVLVYVNTERCCAKELAMWPRQTCPEHLHPTLGGVTGKEETFRCRWGKVFLYVAGKATPNPQAQPPSGRENTYTVWHEIALSPGEQYTIYPDTLHWFQAGDEGAVVSEFSTRSTDELDVFTDSEIGRFTQFADS